MLTQMVFLLNVANTCGQCLQPDCPVSSSETNAGDAGSSSALMDQPFASSMDADRLPELSG